MRNLIDFIRAQELVASISFHNVETCFIMCGPDTDVDSLANVR